MNTMLDRADEIAASLQLALLLEVSAYPKPGNVHRTQDFDKTRYEHFLASAAALGSHFRLAALRGHGIGTRSSRSRGLAIGERIRNAVETCSEFQHGGNTSLGAILLLIPIAYASGMGSPGSTLRAREIRNKLREVVNRTTSEDAVNVYLAVSHLSPGGMGKVPELDVNDRNSIRRIRRQRLSLLDVFQISAEYDAVSSEWANNFSVTFDIGLPFLKRELRSTGNINTAVVDTYLKILSQVPDTLVARKQGVKRAKEISLQAEKVLRKGGMKTQTGRRAVEKMDKALRRSAHRCNPGTTADLTASTLSVLILDGYRP
ncbi:triphosphoribosyl-dephospho-CoA synthase [Candidatus Bathyarchaeota archaeon]|nr:triphosphoribosyl-dephospho-CoA synthase [Candidatus Bathyarchaeota archaeon]